MMAQIRQQRYRDTFEENETLNGFFLLSSVYFRPQDTLRKNKHNKENTIAKNPSL